MEVGSAYFVIEVVGDGSKGSEDNLGRVLVEEDVVRARIHLTPNLPSHKPSQIKVPEVTHLEIGSIVLVALWSTGEVLISRVGMVEISGKSESTLSSQNSCKVWVIYNWILVAGKDGRCLRVNREGIARHQDPNDGMAHTSWINGNESGCWTNSGLVQSHKEKCGSQLGWNSTGKGSKHHPVERNKFLKRKKKQQIDFLYKFDKALF